MELQTAVGHLERLGDLGLLPYAHLLPSLAASMAQSPLGQSPSERTHRTQIVIYYARSLELQGQRERAVREYEQVLPDLEAVPAAAASKALDGGAAAGAGVHGVRVRAARCYMGLDEGKQQQQQQLLQLQQHQHQQKQAVELLEAIPEEERTPLVNFLLARLHHRGGTHRKASALYRAVLKEAPFMLEAAVALVQLGAHSGLVLSTYFRDVCPSSVQPWLELLLAAHHRVHTHDHDGAAQNFGQLADVHFPGNPIVMQGRAEALWQAGDYSGARTAFAAVRVADPLHLGGMDVYATVLHSLGLKGELSRLAGDLMNVDRSRPEPWLVMARACQIKKQNKQALIFTRKALDITPNHVGALHLRGTLCLALEHPEKAVHAHRMAFGAAPNGASFESYKCLANVYIDMNRTREAVNLATQALKLMPHSPRAQALLAEALGHVDGGREKAYKSLKNVLMNHPGCLDAMLALVRLCLVEQKFTEAIELLQEYIPHHDTEFMHTRLADVLTISGDFNKALNHYNTALAMDADSDRARAGLARVHKLLNGETEEDGVEDDDGGDLAMSDE